MRQTRLVEQRGQLDETRRTGSFVVEPRGEPQGEKQHDDGGHRLEKGRAAMLVDQEKTKPPSEVLRHGMSNETINTRTSQERVNARTSSRGQLGLKNDDDRRLTSNDKKEQTRQAMVLVDQRRTRPPSEVPKHGTSNERVDIEMSSERVEAN